MVEFNPVRAAMSDHEEMAHARSEIDRLYSLLEKEEANTEAARREAANAFFAY